MGSRLDPSLYPCAGERHACSPAHADTVRSFRAMRAAWDAEAEKVTGGYATEMAEYQRDHPVPQFRQYLLWRRRDGN